MTTIELLWKDFRLPVRDALYFADGEGSYGSEGFIAGLTVDRALIWAMFFTESNPFDRIQLSGKMATFSSTSGFKVTVDIDEPGTPASGQLGSRNG
ncbi:hypothetical protein ACFXPW_02090 [Streptomyces goshikiensis]|uniref:hypothetical protein n=1 Tax=Streptomyces goshikiensis TaxID=1942 RepID=UPI0036C59061